MNFNQSESEFDQSDSFLVDSPSQFSLSNLITDFPPSSPTDSLSNPTDSPSLYSSQLSPPNPIDEDEEMALIKRESEIHENKISNFQLRNKFSKFKVQEYGNLPPSLKPNLKILVGFLNHWGLKENLEIISAINCSIEEGNFKEKFFNFMTSFFRDFNNDKGRESDKKEREGDNIHRESISSASERERERERIVKIFQDLF